MKELYKKPQTEVENFDAVDVLTVSTGDALTTTTIDQDLGDDLD